MDTYVLGFAFDHLGRVALIRKNKPKWQAGLLNGVGGKVEEGETYLQAMVREFCEETGVASEEHFWRHVAVMEGRANWLVMVYAAGPLPIFSTCRTVTEEEVVMHPLYKPVTLERCIENIPLLLDICALPAGQRPRVTLQYDVDDFCS